MREHIDDVGWRETLLSAGGGSIPLIQMWWEGEVGRGRVGRRATVVFEEMWGGDYIADNRLACSISYYPIPLNC